MRCFCIKSLMFYIYNYICINNQSVMAKSALFVSGEILKRANEMNIGVSNMSLQKILFIANGAYLAKEGKPLIDEPVEVWQYGPVIRNVYHAYKEYGNTNIQYIPPFHSYAIDNTFDETGNQAINFALTIAKQLDAIQLSNWTHLPDSPWSKARESGQSIISNELMGDYFKKYLR